MRDTGSSISATGPADFERGAVVQKIIAFAGKWLPLFAGCFIAVFALADLVSGYSFMPYNDFVYIGVFLLALLICGGAALLDRTERDQRHDKVQHVGVGVMLLAVEMCCCAMSANVLLAAYVIFAVAGCAFCFYVMLKKTFDNGYRLGIKTAFFVMMVFVVLFTVNKAATLESKALVESDVLWGDRIAVVYKAEKFPGPKFEVTVTAKRSSGSLGLGRYVRSGSATVWTDEMEDAFTRPEITVDGDLIYINGELTDYYLE